MTTTTAIRPHDAQDARVARLTAIRARRAGIIYERLTVTVADIQVGDFVDVVHGWANLNGMTFETAITETRTDMNVYRVGRRPVESVWLSTRHGGAVAFPSTFRADIRRPAAP